EPSDDAAAKTLRALQDQQQEILRRLDSTRHDPAEALKKNSELMAERLQKIENTVSLEKQREIEAQQNLNRLFLVALGVVGALGVAGLGVMGLLVLKTIKRLGDVAERTAQLPQLLAANSPALLENATRSSTQRFLESMAQVEARLREMEQRHLSQ